MKFYIKLVIISILTLSGQRALSGDTHNAYYCDPANGLISNPGTRNSPWPSLEEVMRSGVNFKEGDTIYLTSGNHGFPTITRQNTGRVTITAATGESPIIQRINFEGAVHGLIKNITISTQGLQVVQKPVTEHPVYPKIDNSLVQIRGGSSYITLDSCYICSTDKSANWSRNDWNQRAWNGIYHTHTNYITIRHCHIKNVNFGIHNTNGKNDVVNTLYEYNTIENFAGDALRGHGKNTVIQYNTVKNAYDVNGNHDDMLQVVGSSSGLVLRGNKFFNYTHADQPFKGSSQGIVAFSGMHKDYRIEDNLVVVDHWHGISIYGAEGCQIINNVVIDPNNIRPGPAWIQMKHQGKHASTNNLITNNICNTLDIADENIGEIKSNTIVRYAQYNKYFSEPAKQDFSLTDSLPAINN